jgi:hypothetical protein
MPASWASSRDRLRSEEIMKRQIIRSHLAAAALALGVTVACAPALAQKAIDDGGTPPEPKGAVVQSTSKSAAVTTNPYYGRNPDDGGTGPQPTAAQLKAAEQAQSKAAGSQQASAPHLGKPVDDGGTPN